MRGYDVGVSGGGFYMTKRGLLARVAGVLCVMLVGLQAMGAEEGLKIESARWGAGKKTVDVLKVVTEKVKDGRLEITVSKEVMGSDPTPNAKKNLTIVYTVGGKKKTERFEEG